VVVDDGRARATDYASLRAVVDELGAANPRGLGCIAIIPADAKTPSEEARTALAWHLTRVKLRCLCWCVEGSGFQAGMVRAVLAGLCLVSRRGYPTKVVSELDLAIDWTLSRMGDQPGRAMRRASAASHIRRQRRAEGSP